MSRKNQGDYTEPDEPNFYCSVIPGEAQKLEIHMGYRRELPKMRERMYYHCDCAR